MQHRKLPAVLTTGEMVLKVMFTVVDNVVRPRKLVTSREWPPHTASGRRLIEPVRAVLCCDQ